MSEEPLVIQKEPVQLVYFYASLGYIFENLDIDHFNFDDKTVD